MKRIYTYLNPIAHLGDNKYSFFFPFFTTLITAVFLELYANQIIHNPDLVAPFAIFLFLTFIIYFSFREGILGGVTTTFITIGYYLYIIYSRNYKGEHLESGIETTMILAIIYFLLAGVIGWLKETIDRLILRETDEKKRLQSIIQEMPVGVIITDKDGYVTNINKRTNEIIGVPIPIGFKVGKNRPLLPTTHNGKPLSTSQGPIITALTQGKSTVGLEINIIRKDKKKVILLVSATPIHNRKNEVIACVCVVDDITAQKELEERKDDFVNMASHELKTPLTSMKLYIDVLMKLMHTYKDEKVIKSVQNIHKQTNRLQKLINDLLDVSRLQTGKLSFNKEIFSLREVVEETVEIFQASSSKHKITFTKKISDEVYADRFRIYQVITNLITNAMKYSRNGQPVTVSMSKKGNMIEVHVKDQGIGIEKDQQKRIFERLYQIKDNKDNTFPGFGMGLYIAKEIINRHRGRIWVESKKAKGSTFSFSLPLKKTSTSS